MDEDFVLEANGLTKSFEGTEGKIEVLKGLDLAVTRGEVLSIVGASGVGKSTLLQILGSLDKPDNGSIKINGRIVDSLTGRELNDLRNRVIGFVFQFHFLLPEFTALENVMMPGLIGGTDWGGTHDRAVKLLDRVGLKERLFHKPNELSGGEQQRVAVARALTNNPEVILADEPTGNLDDVSSAGLHELVRELSDQEGKTFVVVTHKSEFSGFADRVLLLENGRLGPVRS
ncbi:MAG: ABC transporter ATP-binding protein [Candidatus Latescibacterota bacterium]|nr:MAG: ABC transporter ATP-binding protein [Candidatus Latescibacterota bacterium]